MGRKFIGNVKGVGVESIKKQYYLSTSASELTGGTWEDDVPEIGDANYLWSRWKVDLTNGTSETTEAVQEGIAGAELTAITNLLGILAPEGTIESARQAINFHSAIKLYRTADFTNMSTSYNYFNPLQNVDAVATEAQEGNLTRSYKTIAVYGDRENQGVVGILVGAGINTIQVNASMGMNNAGSSSALYALYICRERDGTVVRKAYAREVIANDRMGSLVTSTVIPVQEGDFIYLMGYKGTASNPAEVTCSYYSTQISAFAIN